MPASEGAKKTPRFVMNRGVNKRKVTNAAYGRKISKLANGRNGGITVASWP